MSDLGDLDILQIGCSPTEEKLICEIRMLRLMLKEYIAPDVLLVAIREAQIQLQIGLGLTALYSLLPDNLLIHGGRDGRKEHVKCKVCGNVDDAEFVGGVCVKCGTMDAYKMVNCVHEQDARGLRMSMPPKFCCAKCGEFYSA